MFVETQKFGKIEVEKEKIISFPERIIGFEQTSKYVLLEINETSPFRWLQAVDTPYPCFLTTDPTLFIANYEFSLSPEDLNALQAESMKGLEIIVIVTVPDDPKNMTANLRGPLIINTNTRIGRQIVLADEKYSLKHKIFLDK